MLTKFFVCAGVLEENSGTGELPENVAPYATVELISK